MRSSIFAVTALLVLLAGQAMASEHVLFQYDFANGVPDAVSPDKRYTVGDAKILGLFNNKSGRWPNLAELRLADLPAGKEVTVAFDLYLVGNWDSHGKLADRFFVTLKNGKLLYELKQFPCRLRDMDDESTAEGNNGMVRVRRRDLGYWIVPAKVVLSPLDIQDGKATLLFNGELTGKGTEFWGLDHVKVMADPR